VGSRIPSLILNINELSQPHIRGVFCL